MISVLIADDEYLIRRLIQNTVQWREIGLEVAGEAADGETALAFIQENAPDIAIVDINMPFMTGIELIKAVYERKLRTKIIVLTGYREFEYAQNAVTYRAFDYILKPIKADELTASLQRAAREIAEQRAAAYGQPCEEESGVCFYGDANESVCELKPIDFNRISMSADITGQNVKRDVFAALNSLKEARVPEDYVKMAALGLVASMLSQLAKQNIPASSVSENEGIFDRLMNARTYESVSELVLNCCDGCVECAKKQIDKEKKLSKLVKQAKEYIEQNYTSRELSLCKIASAIFANPTYISNQFKKELNFTITEYITICRMEEAARLFGENDGKADKGASLYEIALSVGYKDPYYFSKSFKKYFGTSPSRYMEK